MVAVVTAQLALEPHGRWTEHLSAVGLTSAQLVLILVLVTMRGWRTLRILLLIAFAVVATGIVFQVIGDYQVADSIWRTTGNPGFGPGYADGHDRSEFGDVLVLLGGLVFAVVAGVTRRAPVLLAVVAGVMVIIAPPLHLARGRRPRAGVLWPDVGVGLRARRLQVVGSFRIPDEDVNARSWIAIPEPRQSWMFHTVRSTRWQRCACRHCGTGIRIEHDACGAPLAGWCRTSLAWAITS
jgi:hypothetical protein